jgi:hypothetical protein
MGQGIFPDQLKHALVHPLIKKISMEKEDLKSYRPVSTVSTRPASTFLQTSSSQKL